MFGSSCAMSPMALWVLLPSRSARLPAAPNSETLGQLETDHSHRSMKLMFELWLAHMLMAAWIVGPMVALGRRRANWEYWEAVVFVVPFWTWGVLMFSPMASGKSLSNLGEPGNISLAVALAAAFRLWWGRREPKRLVAAVLVAAVVVVAAGVFFFTPVLPEP